MNYKMIGRILTQILLVEAVLMAPSVIWCIIDREPQIIRAFAASIALTLAAAGVLWLACRKAQRGFYAREGFVCTLGIITYHTHKLVFLRKLEYDAVLCKIRILILIY